MTNDEFERKMEFIIEQQAQFSVDIQQLREVQAKAEERMTRLEGIVVRMYEDTDAKFNALVDSQLRLTEAQTQTDQNLKNLVAVVDRYFSGGQNGESQS